MVNLPKFDVHFPYNYDISFFILVNDLMLFQLKKKEKTYIKLLISSLSSSPIRYCHLFIFSMSTRRCLLSHKSQNIKDPEKGNNQIM